MWGRIKHRWLAKRVDRKIPNPRSATPRGLLKPYKRESYGKSVFIAAVGRLLMLAAIIALALYLYTTLAPGG